MSISRDLGDEFEDLQLLSHGGMGAVYVGKQRSLGRTVVVKTILSGEQLPAASTERLVSEGRLLARLAHPNIVTVYDLKQKEEAAYLIEEYIQGVDLRQWMKDRQAAGIKMTSEVFWHLVKQVNSALSAAHAVGIIHRDLKPGNILIMGDLSIKLCDFGISTITTESAKRMSSSSGTLAYMAPELFDDAPPVSRALDYYSLGCILFELLCDANPFLRSPEDSIGRIIKAKLTNNSIDFDLIPAWFLPHQSDLKELLSVDPHERQPAFERLAKTADRENQGLETATADAQATMTTVGPELRRFIEAGAIKTTDAAAPKSPTMSREGAAQAGPGASRPKIQWYRGLRRIIVTLAVVFSLFCLAGVTYALVDMASNKAAMRSNPNYSKWQSMQSDPEFLDLSRSDQEIVKARLSSQWGLEAALTQINNDLQPLLICGLLIPAVWIVLLLLRWFLRGFINIETKQRPVGVGRKTSQPDARRDSDSKPISTAVSQVMAAPSQKPRGWRCPSCGLSNTEFAKACESCGRARPQLS